MKDKIYTVLIWSVGLLASGALIYIVAKYLLPLLLPFIIAYLLVGLTRGGAEKLSKKLKIPKKIVRLVASLSLVILLSLLLGLIVWQVIAALTRFLADIGESNGVFSLLERLFSSERPFLQEILPEELAKTLGESLKGFISSAMSAVGTWATGFVKGLPTAFLFLLVTVISIIYFALDFDKIQERLMAILPNRLKEKYSALRGNTISVMGKYIRSYALIMLITYLTLFVGLSLIRVEHSPIIALLIAFLDILPVLGVGTVLVPWSLVSFALGDKFLGIGLLLLFVVNAVLRQLIEPKILGKSLNLHPLISLGAIYLGYALFGIAGLLLLPIIAIGASAFLQKDSTPEVGESAG